MPIVRRALIPVRLFALAIACVFATITTTGCTSSDQPPTPITASFDMHPVPKSWGSGSVLDAPRHALDLMTGKTPLADVRKMEDKDNPDARRQGIYALASKSWGQVEPYTRRYRQIAQTDPDAGVRAAAIRALNASRDRAAL